MSAANVIYSRVLPGGGLVSIEFLPTAGGEAQALLRVERRGDPRRRKGHVPPVLLERTGIDPEIAFKELYEVAADNVAIARCLIRWQAERRPTRE